MIRAGAASLLILAVTGCHAAPATFQPTDARSPLRLERIIDLPGVQGRIDHLAIDIERRRLFVAEYGNGSVDEVDLTRALVVGRIAGLRAPQGVAYLRAEKEVVVACGDGSVHFYAAADLHEVARLDLGDDADDIRVDGRNGHVVVGYGNGGFAVIDPVIHRVISRMSLPGHPEGFGLVGSRVLVNVPDQGAIIAADIDRRVILSTWKTGLHRLNFPLSVSRSDDRFAVAYRLPAALAEYDISSGKRIALRSTCGDADDLFAYTGRIYVVCGAGHVDVMPISGDAGAIRVITASGARTGLFSPDLRTLFVAAPAGRRPAAIWLLDTDPKG